MKKNLSNWLWKKAAGWQIFLIFGTIGSIAVFVIFTGLDWFIQEEGLFDPFREIIVSVVLGYLMVGWLPTFMILQARRAHEFHRIFDTFDEMVEDAATTGDLKYAWGEAEDWYFKKNNTGISISDRLKTLRTVAETKLRTFEKLGI